MVSNNFQDVITDLELKIHRGETPNIKLLLYKTQFVERGESKQPYLITKDAIKSDLLGMPKVSESLRRDVFNYYNTMLTNDINMYLLSNVITIKAISEESFGTDNITITDYTGDVKDLLSVSKKVPMLNSALESFNYEDNIEDLSADEKSIFDDMYKDISDVLPLIHVSRFNVILQPILPIKSKSLSSGKTLELVDTDLLGITSALNKIDLSLPTILIDSDTYHMYIIYMSNGYKTIRRIQSDWLTSKKFVE